MSIFNLFKKKKGIDEILPDIEEDVEKYKSFMVQGDSLIVFKSKLSEREIESYRGSVVFKDNTVREPTLKLINLIEEGVWEYCVEVLDTTVWGNMVYYDHKFNLKGSDYTIKLPDYDQRSKPSKPSERIKYSLGYTLTHAEAELLFEPLASLHQSLYDKAEARKELKFRRQERQKRLDITNQLEKALTGINS